MNLGSIKSILSVLFTTDSLKLGTMTNALHAFNLLIWLFIKKYLLTTYHVPDTEVRKERNSKNMLGNIQAHMKLIV